jgi:protein ImuA
MSVLSPAAAMPAAAPRPSEPSEVLLALRRAVGAGPPGNRFISLGVASLDHALAGGLACGAVHEIGPASPLHSGAAGTAAGFAAALTALALGRQGREPRQARLRQQPRQARQGWAMWIEPDFAAAEAGALYGPGLDLLGLPMERLVILRVARQREALWAMEEALKCRAISVVVAEIEESNLTATRRLALAAGEGGGLGLILRNSPSPGTPSTAATRWEVASAPSERDRFGGLGPMNLVLSLVKNRRGRTGQWRLSWNHHERAFNERAFGAAALPLPVAAAARNGSDNR